MSETVNAAIKGFADVGSDGIIQFSTGGAEVASGLGVKDMVTGAVVLAKFTSTIAAKYPINVALHTDHCPKDKLACYVHPLVDISAQRVAAGKDPLFQSHMWDGSAVAARREPHHRQRAVQGGGRGQDHPGDRDRRGGERRRQRDRRQASTPLRRASSRRSRPSAPVSMAKYLLAETFGNVHGVYKPGNVKLRPYILAQGQKVAAKLGLPDDAKPFDFVFHGGSGSLKSEIEEA